MGAEDRGAVVRPAERVSESGHVLASAQTLGRGWYLGAHLACLPDGARRARAPRVGDGVHRWHIRLGEKGGSDIGPTKRGKGTKCMVLVERQGLPLGICLASASPAEVTLVAQTLAARVTPRHRKPCRLVGDRGYDSDPLREQLAARGITLISPYRDNRVNRPYEDRRRLRVYRERWIVERTIAWFGAFRRLLIRHERSTRMFLAFFQFAAALIVLRRL